MNYVSYLPDAEGSTNGRILQVIRNPNLKPEFLSFPVISVTEELSKMVVSAPGTFHVVDGVVVPKP